MGAQAVEFDARGPLRPADLTATAIREVRKLLEDHELTVAAVEFQTRRGYGVVEDLGPARCSLELGSWSWVSLAATLNRFDTDIEVLHPPELRSAFAQLAARNAATASE